MCIWVLFFWWRFFFLLHLRFLLLCRVIVHSSSSTEILTRYTAHNQQWLVNFQQLSEMYQRYNKIRCLRLLDVNYSVFSFLLPRFEIAFWTIIGKRMRTNHFKGEEKRFWLNQNCVRVFFFFFWSHVVFIFQMMFFIALICIGAFLCLLLWWCCCCLSITWAKLSQMGVLNSRVRVELPI